MIKNYIFDYGKVIVDFDEEYMSSVYTKNPNDIEILKEIVFDRFYWDKLDSGTITDSEVIAGITKRLPEHLRETGIKVYENWYYNNPQIEGTAELIKSLKAKGAKIFLLSNISRGFAKNYKTIPQTGELLSSFDGLVFSSLLGITKPDKRIFEYLLNKYNLNADETMFIDDREKNVAGANSVGIKGYLFDGDVEKLKKETEKQ